METKTVKGLQPGFKVYGYRYWDDRSPNLNRTEGPKTSITLSNNFIFMC